MAAKKKQGLRTKHRVPKPSAARGWYLLCYDIRDSKRLQRVHYRLKKHGIAAQYSVFFVHAQAGGLSGLLAELSQVIDPAVDSVKAYPVQGPDRVWTWGNPIASFVLRVNAA